MRTQQQIRDKHQDCTYAVQGRGSLIPIEVSRRRSQRTTSIGMPMITTNFEITPTSSHADIHDIPNRAISK